MMTQQIQVNRPRYFMGRLGMVFYITSIITLGWIGLWAGMGSAIWNMVLFTLSFGTIGFMMLLAGGADFSWRPLTLSVLFPIGAGIAIIATLSVFILTIPPLQAPITLPALSLTQLMIPLYGFIGVQEEMFWSGIHIFIRSHIGGIKVLVGLLAFSAFGFAAFHEPVAQQLFGGGITLMPGFFFWLAGSAVMYRLAVEVFHHVGVGMGIHFGWNVFVTYLHQTYFTS